jgi:hypothetical protein
MIKSDPARSEFRKARSTLQTAGGPVTYFRLAEMANRDLADLTRSALRIEDRGPRVCATA